MNRQAPEPPPERTPDPRQLAVALAYRDGDNAPRVVAKGRGLLAEEIIARAQGAGVYVHESPELVSLLMQVDLDERIPPQLYQAVAELLAWLYRLDRGLVPDQPPAPAR
jgi:flagellar biosynthesis protein